MVADRLTFHRELGRMKGANFGYSVHNTTDITKVRPGRLPTSLMNPLIRRLLKEDTGNVRPLAPVVFLLGSPRSSLGVFLHP